MDVVQLKVEVVEFAESLEEPFGQWLRTAKTTRHLQYLSSSRALKCAQVMACKGVPSL